jgi:L-arabinonolactonase
MSEPEVVCIAQVGNACGESPVWDHREGVLYWIDVYRPSLWRLDPLTGSVNHKPLAFLVGSIALRHSGGLVAATERGFAALDWEDGMLRLLTAHEPDRPAHRFNDGKCDRHGRFWAGTVDTKDYSARGELFRLDPDGSTHFCGNDLVTPNGLAFSPDGKTMYLADSRRDLVYVLDVDAETGDATNRREFATTADSPARVDGATVDENGRYWCAHIRDWHVACYRPDGVIEQRIKLPVEHPLMCVFGGQELDTLYVTSGTFLLDDERRRHQPLAGSLFAIRGLGSRGLTETPFDDSAMRISWMNERATN